MTSLHVDRKGKGKEGVSEKRDTNISTKILKQEAKKVREILRVGRKIYTAN